MPADKIVTKILKAIVSADFKGNGSLLTVDEIAIGFHKLFAERSDKDTIEKPLKLCLLRS